MSAPRWVVVVVLVFLVVGLIAFARGRVHHRGDETGARANGAPVPAVVVA